MSQPNDLQAVIDITKEAAAAAAVATPIEPGALATITTPNGTVRIIDGERYARRPRRKTGSVTVHTHDSFIAYINRHKTDGTVVFADITGPRFTAVMDHHDPEPQMLEMGELPAPDSERGTDGTAFGEAIEFAGELVTMTGEYSAPSYAGWADHRAEFGLRLTPEWVAWNGISGKNMTQVALAEFLEDHTADVVFPDAATMIALAKTFEATSGASFKDDIVLESGARKLRFEETVTARAGQTGEIEVPREIELALVPFEGADRYKMIARFRYRMRDGGLSLIVNLIRPDLVIDTAFADILTAVEEQTGVLTLHATAPGKPAPAAVITSQGNQS